MRKQGYWIFVVSWIYLLYGSLSTFVEMFGLPPSSRNFYVIAELSLLSLAIPSAFLLRDNPSSKLGTCLFAFSIIVYSCVGAWFRAFYEFSYAELILIFAFVYQPSRRVFYTTVIGGGALLSAVAWHRFESNRGQLQNPEFSPVLLIIGGFGIIAVFVYLSFSRERNWRDAALSRFGLIGQHASILVHDLKGHLTVPVIQIEMLKERVAVQGDPILLAGLEEVEQSLRVISQSIREINQMGRLATQEAEWFSIGEIVQETMRLFKPKLASIELTVSGDFEFFGYRTLFSSLFLSLFVNAFEAFAESGTVAPKILISVKDGVIRIEDNGGGFSAKILKMLKSGSPTTSKEDGTGLGLFLVRNAFVEMGGSARFETVGERAVIRLTIPKRFWRQALLQQDGS